MECGNIILPTIADGDLICDPQHALVACQDRRRDSPFHVEAKALLLGTKETLRSVRSPSLHVQRFMKTGAIMVVFRNHKYLTRPTGWVLLPF